MAAQSPQERRPAFGSAVDGREVGYYGIFHLGLKGEFEALARWQTRPNGVALSADGRTLYVTDADRHAVVAFDIGRNGEAEKPRDVVRNIAGVPGGIRTDVDGRLYIAARDQNVLISPGVFFRFEDTTDHETRDGWMRVNISRCEGAALSSVLTTLSEHARA